MTCRSSTRYRPLLADAEERVRRAVRGREQVLAKHTFGQRVDTLLQSIAARRAG